ncbi:hypothetical protein ACI1MP_38195 (plasmid) [Kitasatospora griseola]|uniref:hypothetical protein n=1 Tax=Kitasatospora griseola TaxID=2064 RepID=UPI003855CE16
MSDGALIVVALDPEPLARLEKRAKAERERDRAWLDAARARLDDLGLSRREKSEHRRQIRQQHAEARAAGELLGTRDLVVAHALREVLEARGLYRDWPEPPAGALNAPGRRLGTSPERHGRRDGDGGFEARLPVKLDPALAAMVRRAAYWKSAEVYEQLEAWERRWGEGPGAFLRRAERSGVPGPLALVAAAGRPVATAEALEEREMLRSRILTVGDLVRAAVERAGTGWDGRAEDEAQEPPALF